MAKCLESKLCLEGESGKNYLVEVRNERSIRSFDNSCRPSLKWPSSLPLAINSLVSSPTETSGAFSSLRALDLVVFGADLFVRIRAIPIQQVCIVHFVL